MMDATTIEREFARLGPWITQFEIDGVRYGGSYGSPTDPRIGQFFAQFSATTILELGSLEGGHSLALSRHRGVKRVLGVEGRRENVERARFVHSLLGVSNVEFVTANLEQTKLSRFGKFDAVFCVGLLYHLPEPWKLIAQLPRVSKNVYIWTQHAADDGALPYRQLVPRDETRPSLLERTRQRFLHQNNDELLDRLKGVLYAESGLADPLSGMSRGSFWPTLSSLEEMLRAAGFKTIRVLPETNTAANPYGHAVTIAASIHY